MPQHLLATGGQTIIMGVDFGTLTTGVGLVGLSPDGTFTYLDGGLLQPPRSVAKKVAHDLAYLANSQWIADYLVELWARHPTYSPYVCAFELPFVGRNGKGTVHLCTGRGIAVNALLNRFPMQHGRYLEYDNATVKRTIGGAGNADKALVAAGVQRILRLSASQLSDLTPTQSGKTLYDITDGLGIAITAGMDLLKTL